MFVNYKNLPPNSRAWIYQSNRELTDKEIELISLETESFINKWTSHENDLKGSYVIKYKMFLVLFIDQNYSNISGCSIDSSVHFIQKLEREFSIDLTNKMNIAYKTESKIEILTLEEFKKSLGKGKITGKTIVYNNLIDTKEEFEKKWEVQAKDSWHKRFLK